MKYRNWYILVRTFVLVVFFVGILHKAEAQGINARIYFDSTKIMIGEQIRFHIMVSLPKDAKVEFPSLTDTISAEIEILQVFPLDSSMLDDNMLNIHHSYLVTSFQPGDLEVRPLAIPIEFMGVMDTLRTSFASLTVLSPEIDEEKGIYDIKPLYAIPFTIIEVLPWILLTLFILAAVFLIIRYMKRRRKEKELDELILREKAHEIALRNLEKLKGEKLWQSGQHKEYHSRLTDILRKYLENRFGMKAMESTSSEIYGMLSEEPSLEKNSQFLVQEILSTADMVKFARAIPEPEESSKNLEYAVLFILETKYEEQPEPEKNSENK